MVGPELSAAAANAQLLYGTLTTWEARVEDTIQSRLVYENGTVAFGEGLAPEWHSTVKLLKPHLNTIAMARHWYFHHLDGECNIKEALDSMASVFRALKSQWGTQAVVTAATSTTLRLNLPGARMRVPVARAGTTFVGRDGTVAEVAAALKPGQRLLIHGVWTHHHSIDKQRRGCEHIAICCPPTQTLPCDE
jgi:hypothetical protein